MDSNAIRRAADDNVWRALIDRTPGDPGRCLFEHFDGRRLAFGEACDLIGRLARLLVRSGVGRGDRVAGILEKSPEGLLLYFAASRIGAVYLPVHSALTPAEIAYVLSDAEPRLVVCAPSIVATIEGIVAANGSMEILTLDTDGTGTLIEAAAGLGGDAPIAAVGAGDMNALVYTSGTTGKPKGAILTNGLVIWNAMVLAERWRIGPSDRLLHANPMAYSLFGTTTPMLAGGGSLRLLPKFDADAVIAALPGTTMFAGVPTYYARLLARPDFDEAVCRGTRVFITGSAPMRRDLFEAFRSRTGHTLLDRYGSTEGLIVTTNDAEGERRPDCSGTVLDGSELRLVDEAGARTPPGETGRIEVRQPFPFGGYWRDPAKSAAAFTADGWFRTGDFGRLDADDAVTILGRGVDLIISGGLNVYPKEVETAINAFDNIAESAVVGVPHPDFGEVVVAVVEPVDPARDLDVSVLIGHLKRDLAPYKVPKHVEVMAALPRNTLGKIEKKHLKAQLYGLFGEAVATMPATEERPQA